MRDSLERPSDGEVFDTAQVFLEGWDDTQKRFKVTLQGDAKYSNYESGVVSPGSSNDGYDVKTTGGFFSSVTTSYNTQLKNTHEILDITIYLNNDNSNPIVIEANSQFNIEGLAVTNIFIDTPAGYDSSVEVLIFG
jgi:hypothetical protein